MKIILILLLLSICKTDNNYKKIFQFDYSNIKIMKEDIISIFESVNYYINLLLKRKEIKDYNMYNKMYRDLTNNKLKCGRVKTINYNKTALIQKDISFLIIPKVTKNKRIKEFDFRTTFCKDEYSIPRVIMINLFCKNENILKKIIGDEIIKNYIFCRIIQLIFGNTFLELHNLKRNKLISAFPEKYLYFSSYQKFMELTTQNKDIYLDHFSNIGNYSYWPIIPNLNDYLIKEYSIEESLKSSFSEITLNVLREYPYDLAQCDLLFYKRKKCFRVDQKCLDDCSLEKLFMEYYIDEKNKRIICNLKNINDLKNQKCGVLYGNVIYEELMEPKKLNEYMESKVTQKLLLLKPSPICPNSHPRTIFFEYTDYYRDDPYYYIKNKINVDFVELKDPHYFVIGKIDKKESYMNKFRCLISNNILVDDLKDWNYNLYWDHYPNLDNDNDNGVNFIYNKYQLIGKFPDENINKYNIIRLYNKLKDKYPKDFNYMPETYLLPDQIKSISNKFKNYQYNSDNVWILKDGNETNKNNTNKKYPYILESLGEIKNNNEKLILSKYLTNPMLINNKKFILRSFVLVTGFSPLKIYFYRDGYLIFAYKNFSLNETDKNNKCIHFSSENIEFYCSENYDINYENSLFEENCSIWNFLNFERYCKKENLNYQKIINQMKDIIIKTFISLTPDILDKIKKNKIKDRNMFQLFSFDFIIDDNYHIYLLDINKNPSLNSIHLVPVYIYDHLISDVLNIVGVVPFSHDEIQQTFDKNIHIYNNETVESVDDALCEFTRQKGIFELIFPIKTNINIYNKYFETITDENKLLWDKLLTYENFIN